MSFMPGDYVIIDSPGHRAHGQFAVVFGGPINFLGTYRVVVPSGAETFGFLPEELTKLTVWYVPEICQVSNASVRESFPCKETDSGGVQCERLDPHETDHWISDHTIAHSLAGNGYHCRSFKD